MPIEATLDMFNKDDREFLGKEMRDLRRNLDVTPYRIAANLGVTKDYYEALEDGDEQIPDFNFASKLCHELGITEYRQVNGGITITHPDYQSMYYIKLEQDPKYYMTLEAPEDIIEEKEPEHGTFVVTLGQTLRDRQAQRREAMRSDEVEFAEHQKLWLVDLAGELIEDRELGDFTDGVVEFLTQIFQLCPDDGLNELLGLSLGAFTLPEREINTEAVNDAEEKKPYCVVIRNRKTMTINEVMGPITYDDAHALYEDYRDDATFHATLFHLNNVIATDPAGTTKSSI